MKKKFFTGMSKAAIVTVLAASMAATPVFASTGDFYKGSTNVGNIRTVVLSHNLFDLLFNMNSYTYEVDGLTYNAKDVGDVFTNNPNATTEQVQAKVKSDLKGTPINEGLKVDSVSAINAKTLAVTFNKELTAEEKVDAVFSVKLANNNLPISAVVWDGAVAQIQRADKAVLTAGDYEVTVTGVTEEALVETVTVEAQKATSIEIGTNEVKKGTQALGYIVKDQYEDEMTVAAGNITVTAFNTTASTRAVTGTIDALNFGGADVGDIVKITAYLTANTDVKVVKDVIVADIVLGTVELGEPELPEGTTKTRFETGLAKVIIPVTAKDNYGNNMKLTAETWTTATGTTEGLIPTFTAASFTSVAVNAKGNLEVTLGTPGTAKLTITNPATGDIVVKEVKVEGLPDTASITLSQPKDPIRVAGGTVDIPFELKDQFGEEFPMTSAQWDTADVVLSSTNTGVATVAWNSAGTGGRKIQVSPVAVGTTTIYATVATPVGTPGQTVAMLTIEVEAAKSAATITLNGTPTTNLATGQTVPADVKKGGLSFKVVDQDGKAINLAATSTKGVKANLTVVDTDSVLTAPSSSVLMAGNMTGVVGTVNVMSVVAHGTNVGTATVKVQLFNDKNNNDTMDAGEELASQVNVVYTVSASKIEKGAITGVTGTLNADGTAAYAAPNAAQTLTYSLQDQAGNALTTTAATNVTWTVKNTGDKAVTVTGADGAKTLAAGATGTYTTVAAAGASANATLIVNTGAGEPNKLEVTAAAQGVATPAETDVYFTDLAFAASPAQTYTGTVVAFDKTADWAIISTSVGNVVVDYTVGTAQAYTVDGNTASVGAFENALTIGDTFKVTSDGTDGAYALTNN